MPHVARNVAVEGANDRVRRQDVDDAVVLDDARDDGLGEAHRRGDGLVDVRREVEHLDLHHGAAPPAERRRPVVRDRRVGLFGAQR